MKGAGRHGEYCWRVGGCFFDSGVHTWKVKLSHHPVLVNSSAEVGIIDYDEIYNADIVQPEKNCVHKRSSKGGYCDDISLTLDMEKRTLNVKVNSTYSGSSTINNYQVTARRVSPFFAFSSPYLSISLME